MIVFLAPLLLFTSLGMASEHAMRGRSDMGRANGNTDKTYRITITNLTFKQTLGPFFVAVHNDEAATLFEPGQPATDALGFLAEEGSPMQLVEYYTDTAPKGVLSAEGIGSPFPGGEQVSFDVTVNRNFKYISFASMAVNTNDCFVGVANLELDDDMTLYGPGYDAGTENNDESCEYVPGPACNGNGAGRKQMDSQGNPVPAEGFVHIHRGIHGTYNGDPTDLAPEDYDWRNPMIRIDIEELDM